MSNHLQEIKNHTPFNNIKYALFSPLLGALSNFVILSIYALVVIFFTYPEFRQNILLGILNYIKIAPILGLMSLIYSYLLFTITILPTYKVRLNKKWSDGKFWFYNSLIGSIVGLIISLTFIMNINPLGNITPLAAFVIFTLNFFNALFTSSMYTSLIKLKMENQKYVEKP
jgi:hypothetical protein